MAIKKKFLLISEASHRLTQANLAVVTVNVVTGQSSILHFLHVHWVRHRDDGFEGPRPVELRVSYRVRE